VEPTAPAPSYPIKYTHKEISSFHPLTGGRLRNQYDSGGCEIDHGADWVLGRNRTVRPVVDQPRLDQPLRFLTDSAGGSPIAEGLADSKGWSPTCSR
jgi:hypothetical protein